MKIFRLEFRRWQHKRKGLITVKNCMTSDSAKGDNAKVKTGAVVSEPESQSDHP
jgi:hypothetical protein